MEADKNGCVVEDGTLISYSFYNTISKFYQSFIYLPYFSHLNMTIPTIATAIPISFRH